MKTITLTDEQFDTLFEYVDDKVESIVNTSVDYPDNQLKHQQQLLLCYQHTQIEYQIDHQLM